MAVQVVTLEQREEKVKKDEPGSEMYDGDGVLLQKLGTDPNYRHQFVPGIVLIFVILHIAAVYGFYLAFRSSILTPIWAYLVALASSQGIMLGAHRGFSHNSFKMTAAVQIMFVILQTISGQNHIYWWVRDHRLHHKYCDTDADPYNASRGFFFSHIGWLMSRKHPLVSEKGKTIDMSDIEANKFVAFQRRFFVPMFVVFCVLIPTAVPVYCWNESLWNSFFISFVLRYVAVLNMTWCINSVAHMHGTQEFDRRISARQSYFGDLVSLGEGWHNYHHSFPWDHAFSEFGYKGGVSTNFLYFLRDLGLVYDLKKASRKVVYGHSQRHGDGTLGTEKSTLSNPKSL
ncbi:acyl-CoA desaturase [Nasonia vitripennis]|uniref:Fatty acid desaturase domain-containing protein n=1 Tax=Nasonia vitripennis TaxID=7425 RepID=A0A7M7G997_NASVI|nr:acyl-CoA desaturase [Nasonia vitripennis]